MGQHFREAMWRGMRHSQRMVVGKRDCYKDNMKKIVILATKHESVE